MHMVLEKSIESVHLRVSKLARNSTDFILRHRNVAEQRQTISQPDVYLVLKHISFQRHNKLALQCPHRYADLGNNRRNVKLRISVTGLDVVFDESHRVAEETAALVVRRQLSSRPNVGDDLLFDSREWFRSTLSHRGPLKKKSQRHREGARRSALHYRCILLQLAGDHSLPAGPIPQTLPAAVLSESHVAIRRDRRSRASPFSLDSRALLVGRRNNAERNLGTGFQTDWVRNAYTEQVRLPWVLLSILHPCLEPAEQSR